MLSFFPHFWRKSNLICLLILSSFCFLVFPGFGQSVPELMYFKFDGGGTTVPNLASNPVGTNPATLTGSMSQGPSGQFGNALIGTGGSSTNDFVNTGWATNLSGSWTISFWTSNIPSSTTLFYIFGDVNAGGFRCFTNGVAGANNWMLRGTGITDVTINGGATMAPNVTTFVYDAPANVIRGYLNGVLVTTVAQAGPITINGTGPFKVGAYGSNTGLPSGGLMDEFRFYNRALTASEVSQVWNVTLPMVSAPNDAGVSVILSPTIPLSPGLQNVEVTVTNYGLDPLTSAQVYARIDSGATTLSLLGPVAFAGNLAPGASSTPVLLGTHTFYSGSYNITAWTELPNGVADTVNYNDTTSITGCTGLSGVFTINSAVATGGNNFQSYTAAVNAMLSCGISGPVVFNVAPGSGPYNEQVLIPEITGASSVNTITFNGNGRPVNFSPNVSADRYVFRLDGADYVTLNEIVVNVNPGSSNGFGIHLLNGANFNTISNCTINTDLTSTSTAYAGIVISGSTTSATTTGSNSHNNTIVGNTINGGYYGIAVAGSTGTGISTNTSILNNNINESYFYGTYFAYMDAPIIEGNRIILRQNASTSVRGIHLTNVDNGFFISKNTIVNPGIYGIYLLTCNQTATQRARVVNNMVGGNFQGTTARYGIYLSNAKSLDVLYNSVWVDNGSSTYGFYVTGTTSTNLRIKNNSFAATTGNSFALYVGTVSILDSIDNNNYYAPGTNNLLVYFQANAADLAALQALAGPAGHDLNSREGDPGYVSNANLHATGTQLDGGAQPFPGITTDIDGDTRNATIPDMGADEYTPSTIDLAVIQVVNPSQIGCFSGPEDITVTVQNSGLLTVDFSLDTLTLWANVTGPVNQNFMAMITSGTLATGSTLNFTITGSANFVTGGNYTLQIFVNTPNDLNGFNDTLVTNVLSANINVFPYVEDFETQTNCPGTCGAPCPLTNGWINDPNDDMDWTVWNGTTTSTGTGPSTDHNPGTAAGKYLYLETSGTACYLATANLISPCIDLTTAACPEFSFWYHMFGATTGSMHVDADTGNGIWITDIDAPIIGDQGDLWLQRTINLGPFIGKEIRLRIRGITGSSFTGDMAIDNIQIKNSPANDLGVVAVISPQSACRLTTNEQISVQVTNYGCVPQTGFPVNYYVSGPTGTFFSQGMVNQTLNPGDTLTYTFSASTIDFSAPGFYQATGWTSLGTDPAAQNDSSAALIEVSPDTIPDANLYTITDGFTCGAGSVTLMAADSGVYYSWYDAMTGGNLLHNGNIFTTPSINNTTVYYVEGAFGATVSGTVGPVDNSLGAGSNYTFLTDGLVFTVLDNITIDTVFVYPAGPGNVVVNIETASGTQLFTTSVPVTTTGVKTAIPINFAMTPGTGYRMTPNGSTTTGGLFRNTNGASYPYVSSPPGMVTITNPINNLFDFYYFFYDWKLSIPGAACPGDRKAVTATVVTPPAVNLGNDTAYCGGTTLSAGFFNPNIQYLWNTGDSTSFIQVASSGNYSVSLTDTIGCVSSDAINLTIYPQPVVDLGPDTLICGPIVFDAGNSGSNYSWSTGDSTQTVVVNQQSLYSVTVTTQNGCTASDQVNVTYSPLPVDLGPNQNICPGSATLLDASYPGSAYLWSTGDTTQTIVASMPGTYWVELTNINNCTNRDTIEITYHTPPVVNLGNDTAICSNATLTLDAGNPGMSYQWFNNSFYQTLTVNSAGSFWVNVTDQNGCSSFDTILVSLLAAPMNNLSSVTNVCAGQTATLDAGNPGSNYQWSNGATTQSIQVQTGGHYSVLVTNAQGCQILDSANVVFRPNPIVHLGDTLRGCNTKVLNAGNPGSWFNWSNGGTAQAISVNTTGNYSVTVTTIYGCVTTDNVFVVIEEPLPVINLGMDTSVCNSLTLNAGNFPATSYLWNTGATTPTITVTSTGTYEVRVSNLCGPVFDAIHVQVDQTPTASFSFAQNGPVVTFSSQATNATAYLWNFGDGASDNVANPVYKYNTPGTYEVSLTVNNSCGSATFSQEITVLSVGFSANEWAGSFRAWPNPVSRTLYVRFETPAVLNQAEILLTDIPGRIVYQQLAGGNGQRLVENTIDVSALSPGLYFLSVRIGDERIVHRIVVQ